MASFTPPTVSDKGHAPRQSSQMWRDNPLGCRLMRHFGSFPRGRNIYYTTSGVATDVQPIDWDDIAKVWWGGHATEEVTAAEQAALEAAGFTVTP